LLEDAERFRHLIPMQTLVELPLPLLRTLREIQKKREAIRRSSSVNAAASSKAINPTALGDLLDEL
jgi:hypothetical protein